MTGVHHEWKYPPAPQSFAKDTEVFIYNDRSKYTNTNRYCGAWALPDSGNIHKFTLPGADRPDGFYSDPLQAKTALDAYLKEVEARC